MRQQISRRDEYLRQEKQRADASPTLLSKFQELKSLTLEVALFDSEGRAKLGEMKYTPNLANAKSVFRLSCPNEQCVEGDFDLSASLAKAILARQETAEGELICGGWRSRTVIGRVPCHHVLRYKLTLGY